MRPAIVLMFLTTLALGQDGKARKGPIAPTCMPGDHLTVRNGVHVCEDDNASPPMAMLGPGQIDSTAFSMFVEETRG